MERGGSSTCVLAEFEAIPAVPKGSDKFVRAATPGLWRENLSAEETERLAVLLGATLSRVGYK